MAEFTPQQRAVLFSTAKHNLVNTVGKTGKSQILTRIYLDRQVTPGDYKAIYVCPNSLVTSKVLEQLQRITKADWSSQLVGTLAEISYKLLLKYYREMSYNKPPRLVPDTAVAEDRMQAKKSALAIYPDTTNQEFYSQWNKEFLGRMRTRNLASPRSLTLEAINIFETQFHHGLSYVSTLVADDVHDLGCDELLALSVIQSRMERSYIAGNTNYAINDRMQELDQENWITLSESNGLKLFPLNTCFNLSPNQGCFLHQLAAFNSKKLHDPTVVFTGDQNSFVFYEVGIPDVASTVEVIKQIEIQLQVGIRGRTMGVIMRNVDDAKKMASELNKPAVVLWDKNQLWHKLEIPSKGIFVTTPYEAPYLNLDYVVIPNSIVGYWPYTKERNLENCRRLFMRAIGSARLGVACLVPDTSTGILASPFLSEGCNPKLTTKTISFDLMAKTA